MSEQLERLTLPTMGTVAEFTLRPPFHPDLPRRLAATLAQAEQLFSRFLPDSDVSRLSRSAGSGQWVQVHPWTAELLDQTWQADAASGWTCQPLVGPLISLWPVRRWLAALAAGQRPVLPSASLVEQARKLVENLRLERDQAHPLRFRLRGPARAELASFGRSLAGFLAQAGAPALPFSASFFSSEAGGPAVDTDLAFPLLDLGAVAKGYTADLLATQCQKAGAPAALISLGTSSVSAYGEKLSGPWRIAVQNPAASPQKTLGRRRRWLAGTGREQGEERGEEAGEEAGHEIEGPHVFTLPTTPSAFATSGDYLQALPALLRAGGEQNPILVHHLIDPRTGYPATSGIRQASVLVTDPGNGAGASEKEKETGTAKTWPGVRAEVAATAALVGGFQPPCLQPPCERDAEGAAGATQRAGKGWRPAAGSNQLWQGVQWLALQEHQTDTN